MSRSYKYTPVLKDGGRRGGKKWRSKKWVKRQAGKKVRKTGNLGQKSKIYRRVSETWDICDWRSFCSWNPTDWDTKSEWEKWYRRK